MRVIALFAVLFAMALAAPTEVENPVEKPVVAAEDDKSVEKPVAVVSPSSESSNVSKVESDKVVEEEKKTDTADKVVDKVDEVKVEDKVESAQTAAVTEKYASLSAEETAPVPVVVSPADEEKHAEETTADDDAEKQKKIDEFSAICLASTGATLEQVTAVSDNPEDEAPKVVKCYVKCIDEQLGVIKDQVVQNVAALAIDSSTSTTDNNTAVDNCGNLETDDPCDSSYLRYSCYFRTTGKKIQIV